ncbi:MAG: o-succinylbenzoate synthase, partial [bacterium]|nr:o-succinylbenzoate synthase [bacterium]
MKIQKIEIRHLDIPFRAPFTTSFGTITSRHVVIGKFFSTLGETIAESPTIESPIYTEETTWTVMDTMQRHIGPRLIGEAFESPADLARLLSHIKRNYMAKHFVDTAVYHLLSEFKGQSLSQQLGGCKKTVQVGLSIGIEASVEVLLEKVKYAVEQGFKRVKIKIKPGWD